ncbi:hypothetical protein, partial [Comamonas thiooxydans]|uniref:hypothetical protein n=1 Tax=Comamonas thiooxydans TaxID=363952 RepID=UPI001C3F309E
YRLLDQRSKRFSVACSSIAKRQLSAAIRTSWCAASRAIAMPNARSVSSGFEFGEVDAVDTHFQKQIKPITAVSSEGCQATTYLTYCYPSEASR